MTLTINGCNLLSPLEAPYEVGNEVWNVARCISEDANKKSLDIGSKELSRMKF